MTIILSPATTAIYKFAAEFDLSDFGFSEDASVFIEAYNSSSYMRFDFGSVGIRKDPPDLSLSDITPRPLPKFRLKVVDQTKKYGLLLGAADKLIPLRPDEELANKQSLLPVEFCDLGDQIWRLDLSDWPVLELNNQIEGIGEIARSGDMFLGLVYPEIINQILHEIVINQELTDLEFDDTDWTTLWLRFICSYPGVSKPPNGSTEEARSRQEEWIDQAVQTFCREKQTKRRFAHVVEKGVI